ncbi:MAG TPA: tetratricopeptide repeat protein [Vicinamibacterales bacterium]|nr:tetratricopeptide repeat protein [Vicinamibacterales bacterium]HVM68741.1 tetratricopeptide repeat protein [Gaiellaceae bacterium]
MMHARQVLVAVLLAAVVAPVAGCSGDPETRARKYLASGDGYFAKEQYSAAVIEYRNAVKATPDAARAHYKLAQALEASGDPVKAYASYARAADLEPSNLDAHLKAGAILLSAGEYDAARRRAELAVQADPQNPAAHILLGNALAGMKEVGSAIRQMEQAISLDPSYAPAWSALGAARFAGGSRAEAEAAFRKAVALAPNSADARLALANCEWALGQREAAERTLKEALALDAAHPSVHRALALFYLVTRRAPEAEPHFQALARGPGGALALSDYYIGMGRTAEAAAALEPVVTNPGHADHRAAKLRLAVLDHAAGRRAEAHAALDGLLEDHPRDVEARIAKARLLLLDDDAADEAEKHARAAVEANRELPSAHYTLGLAALETRDLSTAEKAFGEVLRINPRAAAAQLQLARLQLARGETAGALRSAEEVARQRPGDPAAAVMLSKSLRAQGDLARAEREVSKALEQNGGVAQLHVEQGELALQRRRVADARAAFEAALRLDPSLHDARIGLITADLLNRELELAQTRVAEWRQRDPGDLRIPILAARVDIVAGRSADAERTLRDVITADASQLEAYDLLGRLYIAQGQADRAIGEFRTLAERSRTPAGALTMIGLIHEAKGDRETARTQYEQVLALEPRAGVAANNLAWMYAESGRAEEAVKLATIAREELRGRPEAEDTLGWAYYHSGSYTRAIAAFERAIERAPNNPVYHYHLGLALAKAGSDAKARQSLKRALDLKPDFVGADDARATLRAISTS